MALAALLGPPVSETRSPIRLASHRAFSCAAMMRATVEADMEPVQQSTRTSGPVMLSVIIPCKNEVRTIAAVLEDLDRQDFFAPFEVIVADGMSGDGTREILDGLIQRAAFRYPLCVVDNSAGTIPCGLNLAVRRTTGAYIARIDA